MNTAARQRQRAFGGAAIITALLAVGSVIFMLDGILARLRSTYTLVAVLPGAPQLATGARVWVSGQDVGEVSSIEFLPYRGDSIAQLAIIIEIPTRVREHVRRDSRIRLTSERMIGEPVIDIVPGSLATPALREGDTLRMREQVTTAQVTQRAAAFRLALDTALTELRAVQAPLEQRLQAFAQVGAQLERAQREYGVLMADVAESPTLGMLQDGGVQTSLGQAQSTLQQIAQALGQLRDKAEQHGVRQNATGLAASAARLQLALTELQAAMQERGGTVDRLMRDSALVRAIAATRAELDSLIADARRRPLRYVF